MENKILRQCEVFLIKFEIGQRSRKCQRLNQNVTKVNYSSEETVLMKLAISSNIKMTILIQILIYLSLIATILPVSRGEEDQLDSNLIAALEKQFLAGLGMFFYIV